MIQTRLTNHDKPRAAHRCAERAVEIGVHAGTNGLQCQAHGLALHRRKPLEAQDIMGADHIGDLL